MIELQPKHGFIFMVVTVALVSAILVIILEAYTPLSEMPISFIAITISVATGIFVEETVRGGREFKRRVTSALTVGFAAGLGAFIVTWIL